MFDALYEFTSTLLLVVLFLVSTTILDWMFNKYIWFVFGFWGSWEGYWCVEAPLVWTRPCLVWNWQQRSVRSGQDTSQQRIIVISLGLNVWVFVLFSSLGRFCFPFSDNDDGSDDDGMLLLFPTSALESSGTTFLCRSWSTLRFLTRRLSPCRHSNSFELKIIVCTLHP